MSRNDNSRKSNRRSLSGKIFLLCMMMVVSASICFAVLGIFRLKRFQKVAGDAGSHQVDVIEDLSAGYMIDMTSENMKEMASKTGVAASWDIWSMNHDTVILSRQVQDILEHPDKFAERDVFEPKKENKGKLVLQLLMKEGAEPSLEEMSLIRKLANLEPAMSEMIYDNEFYTQDLIIALPSGITLTMDTLSDIKVSEFGKALPFDATTRPWWKGAVETGGGYQTLPTYSEILGRYEIEFGVPVYVDGELAAVVEGSISMDRIKERMEYTGYGDSTFFVLFDRNGIIIYSQRKDGELGMDNTFRTSIRDSGNQELIAMLDKAFEGDDEIGLVKIDGEDYYVACGSDVTTDWTLLMFVSVKEIEKPTDDMLSATNNITQETMKKIDRGFIKSTLNILLVTGFLLIIAVLAAFLFSRRLTIPINHMTRSVRNITGDSFNFEMGDIYKTGDEIEVLADTFEKLSVRTKQYITEITEITAERERISAELDVARNIQADMLPKDFPLYPDRNEFDLYATMTPAKEVGGDFYDIFLIDDDHLCVIVGDVSGKGVPAALFMAISKAMLKNRAMTGGKPSEILHDVNNSLCEGNSESMFVTVWLGILTISTGEFLQSNGGHEYPVVQRKDGEYELIETENGLVLGFSKNMEYTDYVIKLDSGDGFFMYTDGLPEATNAENNRLELEGMLNALNKHRMDGPKELLSDVRKEVDAFVKDAPQFDDLTMLIMRFNGSSRS